METVWVVEPDPTWRQDVEEILRDAGFRVAGHEALPEPPPWRKEDLLVIAAELLPVRNPPATVIALVSPQNGAAFVAASQQQVRWCIPRESAWIPHLPAVLAALRTEHARLAESAFYARILEQIEEGVVIEDAEGRFVFVSPRAAQILGYSPQALIGQPTIEIIHPQDRDRVIAETAKRPHGIASQYEARLVHRNGSSLPVWIAATPLFERGEFAGVFVVFRDLTREKYLQRRTLAFQRIAIAISEERDLREIFREARDVLRAIVGGVREVLFTSLDADHRFLRPVGLGTDSPLLDLLETVLDTPATEIAFPLSRLPPEWHKRLARGRPVVSLNVREIGEALFGPAATQHGIQMAQVAGLAVLPLRAGGLLRGVVALTLDRPHILEEDLDLAMAAANLVAAAMESRSLLEQARYRTYVLDRLFDVAQAMAASTETTELALIAARQFIQAFGLEEASISLWDRETDVLRVIVDLRHDPTEDVFKAREGQKVYSLRDLPSTRWVLENRQPLQVLLSDSEADSFEKGHGSKEGVKTLVILPMVYKGESIGAVELEDPHAERRLNPEQMNLAMTMAGQVAAVLENARLLAETQRRATQLRTAAEVARDATGILDVETLISRAAELIRERFDLHYVGVFLLDESREWAVLRAGTGSAGHRMLQTGHRLKVGGSSMIGWCIANGQARIALDVGKEAVRFDNPLLPETRSEMALPLISRGRVIGAMTIQSTRPAAFSEEDVSILETMAGQLANAIENARLHANLRRHLNELAVLNEIGRAITAVLDLRQLVEVVHREISRFLPASHFYVALWDREADTIRVPVVIEKEQRYYDQEVGWEGLIGWVLQHGEPLLVDDAQQPGALPSSIRPTIIGEAGIRSLLAIPLFLGGEVIGAFSLQSTQPASYTQQDLVFLTAVGRQIAVAFQNARLYDEVRRRAEELTALNAIAARLGQTLELEEVLNTAIEEVVRALDVEASAVSLVDQQSGYLTIRAQRGLRHSYVGMQVPLYQGLSGLVVRTGEVVITGDVGDDPRLAAPAFAEEGIQAMALVPMRAHGKVVGVLSAMDHHPHEFTDREIAFLEAIASQVGMAVENARLFEAERVQRHTAETLRNVGAVLTSSLEVGRVLQWLLEYLEELVPYDRATVMLLEEERLRVAATRGYEQLPDGKKALGHTVRLDEDVLLSEVVQNRKPVLIQDAAHDPRWRYPRPLWVTRSWIGVPLTVRGRAIGMLTLAREHPKPFGEEDAALAADIAGHAAIAIENARLYREVQEHAAQLEEAYAQLKEADRLKDEIIQNVSHELRTPLTFIKGYIELLKGGELGPLTAAQRESLEIVARRTGHLTRLISDFVTLQVVSRETLNLQAVDLGQLARTAVEDCRTTATQAGIEVRAEIPPDLPPALADSDRVAQVLDNLLSNAIKFSPEGGTITVRVTEEDGWLRTEVSDTGIGIPADKVARVFERFYQVDGTSRRRFGGAGLGLAIVKQIVEAHGGEVGATSEVRKGSTFYFTLPRADQGLSSP